MRNFNFNNMTDEDFRSLKKECGKNGLTPFARFLLDSRGYSYITTGGKSLDYWEVKEMGHTDVSEIKRGKTNIRAILNK